jgi:hypothetical protein
VRLAGKEFSVDTDSSKGSSKDGATCGKWQAGEEKCTKEKRLALSCGIHSNEKNRMTNKTRRLKGE